MITTLLFSAAKNGFKFFLTQFFTYFSQNNEWLFQRFNHYTSIGYFHVWKIFCIKREPEKGRGWDQALSGVVCDGMKGQRHQLCAQVAPVDVSQHWRRSASGDCRKGPSGTPAADWSRNTAFYTGAVPPPFLSEQVFQTFTINPERGS